MPVPMVSVLERVDCTAFIITHRHSGSNIKAGVQYIVPEVDRGAVFNDDFLDSPEILNAKQSIFCLKSEAQSKTNAEE